MKISKTKGFTLIELMVVISIISLLSSIVFSALNNARSKAKDAAIKVEVSQLEKLFALNYNYYGSYCQLVNSGQSESGEQDYNAARSITGWVNVGPCDNRFYGIYENDAIKICQSIDAKAKQDTNRFLIYVAVGSGLFCREGYSIAVKMNTGTYNWYCSGSSGRKGVYTNYNNDPGCYLNP